MNIRNLIVLFMVTTGLFAQSVMGTVFDANSRPLEGANVVLVGTDLGDTANDSGAYAMIDVPAGTYVLITLMLLLVASCMFWFVSGPKICHRPASPFQWKTCERRKQNK